MISKQFDIVTNCSWWTMESSSRKPTRKYQNLCKRSTYVNGLTVVCDGWKINSFEKINLSYSKNEGSYSNRGENHNCGTVS